MTDVEVQPERTPGDGRDATARIRRTLEGVLGIPSTEGNRIDVLRNGDEIFPAMLEAIRSAQKFIDFLTFVYWTGPIAREVAEALTERARAGVRVRVILDAVGARTMDRGLIAAMEEAGADVEFFRAPITWRVWEVEHRTHRKVLIVDEKVAFTGGVGIAEEWMGDARGPHEWRDTHFRIQGPAVDGIRGAFTTNWIETGRAIFDEDEFIDQPDCGSSCLQVVRGAASIGWSDIAVVMRTLVALAEERIRITSAYFTPDPAFVELVCEAADRGVEIDVLVPGPHADKRIVQVASEAVYERLLDCGIRIWNYQPTMLHAKVVTVDGAAACVGSSNVNSRSMARDDEVSVMIYDTDVVGILDSHFEEDLERSGRITEVRWEHRNIAQRALETATNLIRPRL